MLKRKEHIHKKLYLFIIYTIITFAVGLILKVVLVSHLFDKSNDISDKKEFLDKIGVFWDTHTGKIPQLSGTQWADITDKAGFEAAMDNFSRQQHEQKTALFLQFAIVILTLVIYSRSLWDLRKLYKDDTQDYTHKRYKSLIIEYSIFLTLFIAIDSYALYLVLKENAKVSGWLIYTFSSLFIPTFFAIGSLVLVRKTKSLVVK